MRIFQFVAIGVLCSRLPAQDLPDLQRALTGLWAGTLEYRDFSEPATSTKRVKLPTWLHVEPVGSELRFRYIYDDGPTKTVKETSVIRIDLGASSYTVLDEAGKIESVYAIGGLPGLKSGRGTLILSGRGTENNVAVDVRTTLRIGRNILEILRETSVPGQPYTFRHAYTFVRASEPAP